MSETVIRVEGLSKRYRLGMLHQKANSFRDVLTSLYKKHSSRKESETIWALKEVSFEVKEGEILGIIGRNGAGKSTLLKILSRITKPDSGQAFIDGRVGSLLEVGTGFHPELTGRENIYLNGAILGMSRAEIKQKFDEIVAFAEIEKFVDTPVKRYSSGMYVRLAFAVAAHLDPDILLIDEVLAVGDAAFQKKCMGKMGDVSKGGKTILFVSHNMGAIQRLCNQCIMIDLGRIEREGNTTDVIEYYLSIGGKKPVDMDLDQIHRNSGLGRKARITSCRVYDIRGKLTNSLAFGQPFIVELSCRVIRPMEDISFLVGIDSIYEQRIVTITSLEAAKSFSATPGERVTGRLIVRNLLLKPGFYTLTLGLFATNVGIDRVPNCIRIEVVDISYNPRHVHIDQVTEGMIQIPDPTWQIKRK